MSACGKLHRRGLPCCRLAARLDMLLDGLVSLRRRCEHSGEERGASGKIGALHVVAYRKRKLAGRVGMVYDFEALRRNRRAFAGVKAGPFAPSDCKIRGSKFMIFSLC